MTQRQLALQGVITNEMKQVADYENLPIANIVKGLQKGTIVIPHNINRDFQARAIGEGLKTKINANLGTSEMHCVLSEEMDKLRIAIQYGADSVMDLSTGGNLAEIRKSFLAQSPVMIGTVPIYSAVTKLHQKGLSLLDMSPDDIFTEIEEQAVAGVDFMTLHCGITNKSMAFAENTERVLGIVSRGGSLLKRWMKDRNEENPLYAQFDRLLAICEKYDVTISLGDGFRPGALADAGDRTQIAELLLLGELVERCYARGVQVMVEGPGHVPLHEVVTQMQMAKKICKSAPLYVLGPLVTDIAPGYDHITGAIGGALAAANGADFLCYVTPAEHLVLPEIDDVKLGVIASKIAAHSADLSRGIPDAMEQDYQISKARYDFDWERIYQYSIDPQLARNRKENSESKGEEFCTMCGKLCAVRTDKNEKI